MTLFDESPVRWLWFCRPSKRADEADDASVVDESVNAEDAIEGAYEDVEDADIVFSAFAEFLAEGDGCGGRGNTEKRTGSSLRWSNS